MIRDEWVGQHSLVVVDMFWEREKKRRGKTEGEVIKWFQVKKKEEELREKLLREVDWGVSGGDVK